MDKEIFMKISVDEEGILGRIADLEETAEKMWHAARGLKQMILTEQKKTAESIKETAGENS